MKSVEETEMVFSFETLWCVCAHTDAHVPVGERNLFKHRSTLPSSPPSHYHFCVTNPWTNTPVAAPLPLAFSSSFILSPPSLPLHVTLLCRSFLHWTP